MDWQALILSIKLSLITLFFLFPIGILLGRSLAYRKFWGQSLLQTLVALPLILPPSVMGYYLLLIFSPHSDLGHWLTDTLGIRLAFSFQGLVVASILFNLPFAIQPIQRAFASIPTEIREAAACCGLSPWQVVRKIELPLAWPGIISAMVMCFAHTMGEFGIVLMVGGNIPSETRTIAIAIYDRVQAFDNQSAATMSLGLLIFSMLTISLTYWLGERYQPSY